MNFLKVFKKTFPNLMLLFKKDVFVRWRLFRVYLFSVWKKRWIEGADELISQIRYQDDKEEMFPLPSLIISTNESINDFKIIAHVFKDHELVWLVPRDMQADPWFQKIKKMGRVIFFERGRSQISLLRKLLAALKFYNRSAVLFPETKLQLGLKLDYSFLVRLAIKTNAPIQPVVISWDKTRMKPKCDVLIGKKIAITPRHPDFKAIFFKRRGARKFSRLSLDECREVGIMVQGWFETLKLGYGSDISK